MTNPTPRKPAKPIPGSHRVRLEPLEVRQLLAASIVNDYGQLHLIGESTTANTMSVDLSTDKSSIIAKIGSLTKTYPASSVQSIRIEGGSAADKITLGAAVTLTSEIKPGAGNDVVTGGSGSDNVFETSGSNSVKLGAGDDYFYGGTGADTVYGGTGNDVIVGATGYDTAFGEDGNDFFNGTDASNFFNGGNGTDTSINSSGRSSVENYFGSGGSVPSSLTAKLSNGVLTITGNASSANAINVSEASGAIKVAMGPLNQSFTRSAVTRINIIGGSANDFISVGSSIAIPTSINGSAGNDTLYGGASNDTLIGGSGNDRFGGNAGADLFNGDDGDDAISGNDGNDTINGGNGKDRILGLAGADKIDGGADTDYADGGDGADSQVNVENRINIESATSGGSNPPPAPVPDPSPTTGSVPADASAVKPVAKMTTSDLSINAGQAVFVHGLGSILNAGTALTARYEWNFGDTGSDYNTLVGFNAGHTYNKAGTYTVTLRVLNEKRGESITKVTVNVSAASRKIIYVSNDGSDSNAGTSSGSPVRSAARAASLIRNQSDVEVLFAKGDTFDLASTISVSGQNVRLGSYGSGTDPVLRWNGAKTTQHMVRIEEGSTGAMIDGLVFDSIFTDYAGDRSGMPYAIKVNADYSLIKANTFLNLGFAVQTNAEPTGLLMQSNKAPSQTGLRNYLLWGQGSDFVILGNDVTNVLHEHAIRIFGVDRILLSDNDLANPTTYSFEPAKNALNLQEANYVYAEGNTIHQAWQIGPLGNSDGYEWVSARLNNVVIENNVSDGATLNIVHGAQNVMIRNNIIKKNNENAIVVDGFNTSYNRGVANLTITNNTAINTGDRGRFLYVGGSVDGITLTGNLYKADNLALGSYGTSAVMVNETSLKSFKLISNNVWPDASITNWVRDGTIGNAAINIVGPSTSNLAYFYGIARWNALTGVGTDYQQDVSLSSLFTPSANSYAAINGANYAGVFTDHYGKVRPTNGNATIGAVQV